MTGRQVMHARGIVVDDQVLFSTGAVMDTKPITKADFSIELPNQAAKIFQSYVNEPDHGDATHERRAELAAELARLGVIINEPVAGLTYVSRAQDALIRGARLNLTLSLSELIDPFSVQTLIHRAARGVDVMIQVHELDAVSARLLTDAMASYPNLRLEDMSWWEPRPHFNVIVADGAAAYIGASYLWSTTQRNMVRGRSFENGVLLSGDAAARIHALIDDLRINAYRNNPFAMACSIFKSWSTQYSLCLKDVSLHFEHAMRGMVPDLQLILLMATYTQQHEGGKFSRQTRRGRGQELNSSSAGKSSVAQVPSGLGIFQSMKVL